jgi:hypothetical protein
MWERKVTFVSRGAFRTRILKQPLSPVRMAPDFLLLPKKQAL